jgi:hypothetical protein
MSTGKQQGDIFLGKPSKAKYLITKGKNIYLNCCCVFFTWNQHKIDPQMRRFLELATVQECNKVLGMDMPSFTRLFKTFLYFLL